MRSSIRHSVCILALGVAAAALPASCIEDHDGARPSQAAPPRSGKEASGPARELLASVRARFILVPPALDATLPAHMIETATPWAPRPALGVPLATGFEQGNGWIEPQLEDAGARAVAHPVRVRLPAIASGTVHIEDVNSAVAVGVVMVGATGVAVEPADGYAVYRGATPLDVTVIHRPSPVGTEDFVLFDERPSVEEVAYDVSLGDEVAGLRLVSNTLEILDEEGTPRLRVAPPYLVDARGRRHAARLSVSDCDHDADPRVPWGRAVTPPGNTQCRVVVSWTGAVEYPALLDPAWTSTGSLPAARGVHVASILPSGNVLVAGGTEDGGTPINTAAVYNTATGTWAATGPMATARYWSFTANLLGNGLVLVAGGQNGTATAERYNPATGTWSATANNMSTARYWHTATLLSDGRVLAAGGYSAGTLASGDIYNPATNQWSATPTNMPSLGRYNHTANLLANGKVLVAGGHRNTYLATAEVYDPALGTWAATGNNMANTRSEHASVGLANGRVLVSGGYGLGAGDIGAEVYDPATNVWTTTGNMTQARQRFTLTLLGDGRVLAAGTQASTSAEIYDPTPGTWGQTSSMATNRFFHTATMLGNGKVLVAGGCQSGAPCPVPVDGAELFERLPNGSACQFAGECTSNFCADGFCCNTACNTLCQACSAAKKGAGMNGTCGAVAASTDPDNECSTDPAASCQKTGFCGGAAACQLYASGTVCLAKSCASATSENNADTCNGTGTCTDQGVTQCLAGYACVAGACKTTCAADADCATTHYCSGNACVPDDMFGAACTAGSHCQSGFCVDGFCCDQMCTGLCSACSAAKKGAGMNGACGSISMGTDPDNECSSTPASTCGQDGSCNGGGACQLHVAGTECVAQSCASPTSENDPDTCNGTGTCTDQGVTQCLAGYACVAGACKVSCAGDADCAAPFYCNAGMCVPDDAQGAACSSAGHCQSGFCADGVCCDAACDGACEACSAAKKGSGADGACAAVAVDTDPDDECAQDPAFPTSCQADGLCDGTGQCRQYGKLGIACGMTTCTNGTLTGLQCNGAGSCVPLMTSCDPYVCDGDICAAACAGDADCVAGFYCDGTACVAKQPDGTACAAPNACESGLCVDAYCCNTDCNGQCEACDAPGDEGICTPVSGEPHGDRPECEGAGETCGGACDGVNTAACVYPGSSIECGSTCEAGQETKSSCDGTGQCAAGAPEACTPYVCDADACKTSCQASTDCESGYACSEDQCKPQVGAVCDGDHTLTNADGTETDCAPYVCAGTTCKTSCSSIDDCVEPTACDPSGKCVTPEETPGDTPPGCGCQTPGRLAPDASWLSMLAAAGLFGWARRRRRAD